MREIPRQPSNLDPVDRDALATLGYRIERWDILTDESLSLEDRKQKIIDDIELEIAALRREQKGEELELQIDDLDEAILEIEDTENTPQAFKELAEKERTYYTQIRNEYLKLE